MRILGQDSRQIQEAATVHKLRRCAGMQKIEIIRNDNRFKTSATNFSELCLIFYA